MAERDSKAPKVVPAGAFPGFPMIAIPETTGIDAYGHCDFNIATDEGEIAVSGGRGWAGSRSSGNFRCSGSCRAFFASGIVAREWFVPNRDSWSVVFGKDGPQVRVGGKGTPKGLYVQIRREGRRNGDEGNLYVTVPMSGEAYEVFERVTREHKSLAQPTPGAKIQRNVKPGDRRHLANDAYFSMNRTAAIALDALRDLTKKPADRARCTPTSETRILRLIGELRRAVAEACVEYVAAAELARAGNVVYLPGTAPRA